MKILLRKDYAIKNHFLFLIQDVSLYQDNIMTNYFILTAASLAGISLLLVCILYIRRSVITIRDNKVSKLKFRYQYLIYDALVESQTEQSLTAQDIIVNKLKKEISQGSLHKQVLIDLIIDLKKNFTGDSEKQFTQLYHALSLPKYSLNKLNHYRWDVQAKGIKELTEINYNSLRTQLAINNLTLAKNDAVSHEAQVASVRLRKAPLQFLQNLQAPLTEWQQINLHNILLKLEKRFVPDFTKWLSSPNTSVVIFSLRMIADFEQKKAAPDVVSSLLHKLPEVREETVKTLIQLNARDFLPQIINASQSCSQSVISQVLEAMELWGTHGQHTFLESLKTNSSTEIREKATMLLAKQVSQNYSEKPQIVPRTV